MKKKKGFTLVELLAVIVVLAIILVIAVPKILDVIKSSRENSLISSVKLVARNAEQKKLANEVLGNTSTINCSDVADINNKDYALCNVSFSNDEATVIMVGKGKFEGYSCAGTKNDVMCGDISSYITNLKDKVIYLSTYSDGNVKSYMYDSNYNEISSGDSLYTDYRYYGSSPKNYVEFNDELWRIIGVVDGKIKLLRNESLLNASWDSSLSSVNGGHGVNEWSNSDIMHVLNDYYFGESSTCNYCNNINQATCVNTCNFAKLHDDAKSMIDSNTTWFVASTNTNDDDYYTITAKDSYKNEHGSNTGKICDNTNLNCNDTVERTTRWVGAVGLMSASDYGYATDTSMCTKPLSEYDDENCYLNDWIYNGHNQVTISPGASSNHSAGVAMLSADGFGTGMFAESSTNIVPSVYLKSNIEVIDGDGSSDNPFVLELK